MSQRWSLFWEHYVSGLVRNIQDFKKTRNLELIARDADGYSSERFLQTYDDTPRFVAPTRLAFPSHFNSPAQHTQDQRADWQHVDPRLMQWQARFIEAARQRNIPLYCHAAFRTESEQNALVAKRVSRATYPNAPHCQGKAVDIVHGLHHWEMTKSEWAYLQKLGYEVLRKFNAQAPKKDHVGNPISPLELVNGASFSTLYDPAHWEVRNWRSNIDRLKVGEPLRYTPRYILRNLR